jgi:hypothetical protein
MREKERAIMGNEATQWFAILHWNATCKAWIARTDTEEITVPEETYHQIIKEHLTSKCIEMQTWTYYIRIAEAAWKRQCDEERHFQGNLDFWKSLPEVDVVSRNKVKAVSEIRNS